MLNLCRVALAEQMAIVGIASEAELARMIGVTKQSFNEQLIKGTYSRPTLSKLCIVLKCGPDAILRWDRDVPVEPAARAA